MSSNRVYREWNNSRNYSDNKLNNIPFITNTANGKRYYSSLDGELYFGNIFIDEVTNISWQMQQQALPIYGYNSYTFDDIATGNRIVQGQFSINFTEENFLIKLQQNSSFQRVARKKYAPDSKQTTSYSDYRARLHLPVWDGGFDLVIGFGSHSSYSSLSHSDVATFIVLDCCQITGTMLQLDMNGQPVQQIYTFIARDIKTTKTQSEELSTGNKPSSSSNNNNDKTDDNNNKDKDKNDINSSANISGKLILKDKVSPNIIIEGKNIKFVGSYSNATLLFKDVFSNKKLTTAIALNVDEKKNIATSSLLPDFYKELKKEVKDKNLKELVATVIYKYTTNDSKQSKEGKTDIKLPVEI